MKTKKIPNRVERINKNRKTKKLLSKSGDFINQDIHFDNDGKPVIGLKKKKYEAKDNDFDITKSPFFPKNVNVYNHLCKDHQNNPLVNFSVTLRGYPYVPHSGKYDPSLKHKGISPPFFYEEDSEKYKKKLAKSKSTNDINENWGLLRHLERTTTKFGEKITTTNFSFSTTLRNFRPCKGVFVNNLPWKKYTGKPKRPNTSYMKKEMINDKYLVHPYSIVRDKIVVGNDTIVRRKFVKKKAEAEDWNGDHVALPKFNDKYYEKDFCKIKNYLCEGNRTNSQCWFQLGLRGNYVEQTERPRRNSKSAKEKVRKKSEENL